MLRLDLVVRLQQCLQVLELVAPPAEACLLDLVVLRQVWVDLAQPDLALHLDSHQLAFLREDPQALLEEADLVSFTPDIC